VFLKLDGVIKVFLLKLLLFIRFYWLQFSKWIIVSRYSEYVVAGSRRVILQLWVWA